MARIICARDVDADTTYEEGLEIESDTESAEMIFAYGGVSSKEAAETVLIPDPRVK